MEQRELPPEYLEKIGQAIEGNPQIQRQITDNFQKLQKTLDGVASRVAKRNQDDINRWKKAVGPVKDFAGVITRF